MAERNSIIRDYPSRRSIMLLNYAAVHFQLCISVRASMNKYHCQLVVKDNLVNLEKQK